jgi:hypothetical protein
MKMKKSIVSIAFVSAIFCGSLALQSCAERTETTYSEPPYYSSTTTYGPDYAYNSYPPPYSDTYGSTTYTTTTSEPDSVVGSTAHAAGTIIAAPFRLVGDAMSIIF